MIGLIIKNNLCLAAFSELLAAFETEAYQADHTYDALITTDLCDCSAFGDTPIITVGLSLKGEFSHIDTPVHPNNLAHQIQSVLTRIKNRATFENTDFLFRSTDRSLLIKKTNDLILLTEKENDLLTALATAYPNSLDKETLLKQVWNYKPDTETHTLESHIYTLRQKIGAAADSLIQSTPTGYVLITDPLPD